MNALSSNGEVLERRAEFDADSYTSIDCGCCIGGDSRGDQIYLRVESSGPKDSRARAPTSRALHSRSLWRTYLYKMLALTSKGSPRTTIHVQLKQRILHMYTRSGSVDIKIRLR